MQQNSVAKPALSPYRAFVVQFYAETDVTQGRFAGRVEHVVSGRTRRFQTLDELLAHLVQMLTTLGATPDEGREGVHEGTNEPLG